MIHSLYNKNKKLNRSLIKSIKLKDMKKVLFYQLDGENKLTAVSQMFGIFKENNYPNGATWNSEEELLDDLEKDYNPNVHFSYYIDEYDEVVTKIG